MVKQNRPNLEMDAKMIKRVSTMSTLLPDLVDSRSLLKAFTSLENKAEQRGLVFIRSKRLYGDSLLEYMTYGNKYLI